MARAEYLEDLTCLRHPGIKAVARCAQCVKPLCESCIITHEGESFCSRGCADKREEFRRREQALAGRRRAERTSAATWAQRGLIVFLVAAIGYYVFVYAEVRSPADFVAMLKRIF